MNKNRMLKIAICDDEEAFLCQMKQQICGILQGKGIFYSIQLIHEPSSLVHNAQVLPYHILFLDVKMGKWNGIELAARIRQYNAKLMIIYVSEYLKFSPEGYRVNAFRYLLKSELDKTLADCVDDCLAILYKEPERLQIMVDAEPLDIALDDIMYIESQRALLLFHLANGAGPALKSYATLRAMEKTLLGKGFARIQKSYIVNFLHVRQVKNYMVVMKNGDILQAGRKNFRNVQEAFLLWKGRV